MGCVLVCPWSSRLVPLRRPRSIVSRSSAARSVVALDRHGAVVHEHDLGPACRWPARMRVDRRRLQFGEEHLVSPRRSSMSSASPAPVGQAGAPSHHSASVLGLEVCDLPRGRVPWGAVVVKNASSPSHIAQRNRVEVRHDDPGIAADPLDVGSQGGEGAEPVDRAPCHCKDHQVR